MPNKLSLSKRIEVFYLDGVWNELPENKKTTVKARLVEWQGLAEALENGKALAEAEGEIVALQAENEALKSQKQALESQNRTLDTQSKDFEALYNQATEAIQKFQSEDQGQTKQARAQGEEIGRLKKEIESLKVMSEAIRSTENLGRNPGLGLWATPPPMEEREWPEEALRTLQRIADCENGSTAKGLAAKLVCKVALMEHFLNEFRDAEFISPIWDLDEGVVIAWGASEKGLAFLFKKGLLG